MSDSSTNRTDQVAQTAAGDAQQGTGPGRHRGEVSAQEAPAAPNGRHRKPEPATTAAA